MGTVSCEEHMHMKKYHSGLTIFCVAILVAAAVLTGCSPRESDQGATAVQETPAAAVPVTTTTAPSATAAPAGDSTAVQPVQSVQAAPSGSFTGSSRGQNGDVTVSVSLEGGVITSVQVVSHAETPEISDLALTDIPSQIVASQSLAVDTVAGATVTSTAVIEAVADALGKAGLDVEALRIKEAGAAAQREPDIEKRADVVVIGAGGAGLAAAVSANEEGATVIVLEKMPRIGGNTILSGGALNAVDEGSETAIAHDDSVEKHYTQTLEGGDRQGDPALVHVLTDNAWSAVSWLKGLGMKFLDGVFTVTGGLWPRAHKPADPVGTGFFKTYSAYIDSHDGIEVMLETKAEHLLVENGRITGVIATGRTGNTVTVLAEKGVILATGGFGQNIAMREEYNTQWPTLDESIKSTNHPGATGDGIAMAAETGAALVQMENIQLLPLGDPETGSLSGNIEQDVEKRIFVNIEGNRFVDEGARRDVMTAALFAQPENKMWIIVDAHSYPNEDVKNNFNESIAELLEAGRAYRGDTIEELAAKINVDAANLKASLDDFNAHAASRSPDTFGRTLYSEPIDTPPFYAAARIPTVHHTMGGVKIDTETHVIDTAGNIIPGLYAAGEVTGGIHGSNRLGGNALTDITVFGIIAGKNAAAGI